jgi:hypothetical protein
MPAGHPRKKLAEELTEALPDTWRIIPEQRNVDPQNRTVVVVKQRTLVKNPAAPNASRLVGFTLTLISRYVDTEKAEDDLDVTLPVLLAAIDGIPNLRWDEAEKVAIDDTRLGYDVTVQAPTKKENL